MFSLQDVFPLPQGYLHTTLSKHLLSTNFAYAMWACYSHHNHENGAFLPLVFFSLPSYNENRRVYSVHALITQHIQDVTKMEPRRKCVLSTRSQFSWGISMRPSLNKKIMRFLSRNGYAGSFLGSPMIWGLGDPSWSNWHVQTCDKTKIHLFSSFFKWMKYVLFFC